MSSEQGQWTSVSSLPGMTLDDLQARPGAGNNVVFFSERPVLNNHKTKARAMELGIDPDEAESKCPIYEPKTFITILIPSDNTLRIEREVKGPEKKQYPVEWARWQQTKQNRMPGIPLEQWPALSDTQRVTFRAMNIFTVDQMANLDDAGVARIMGGVELRRRAQAYIEQGKDVELLTQVRKEAADVQATMQKQIDELRALLESQTAPVA